ncbi:sucrase ferredoxin [Phormidesmis priestleyi]
MSQFFCAQMSRESGEDIIGSAPNRLMYVLIECPYPWATNEFDSKGVPPNLKALVDDIQQAKLPIRFLLFVGEKYEPTRTRVMIFRKPQGLISGYHKREFEVGTIDQVAPLLQQYLANKGLEIDCEETTTQDIFVCTHGSHDKCCAKFGYPFYRQAIAMINDLQLGHTQIWQVSHIGGHRFAPTIVTFPDGRYYGTLTNTTFRAILQRTGDIRCLQAVYRGWGILPKPVQIIEREIALYQGWKWFQYQVAYKILSADQEIYPMQIELRGQKSGQTLIYIATVIEGETSYLMSSCNRDRPSKFTKFVVKDLRLLTDSQPSDQTDLPRKPQSSLLQVSGRSLPTPLK